MIVYRVDRRNEMHEGQQMSLHSPRDMENEAWKVPREMTLTLERLFPEGVTTHANTYIGTGLYLADSGMQVCELIFEYVRLSLFSEKPSRYQAFFGFERPEDRTKVAAFNSSDPIYEVEVQNYSKHDMNWLVNPTSELSIPMIMMLAEKYWSGKKTENPIMEILFLPPAKVLRHVD